MKIINLTKEYKISKTQKIIALNSISFDLPNKGLIFILGKSGSGKSTLLNILSGLDNFDSGDIYFKRKRFSSFTQNDLDGYRNSYCGIIFQEYNLIPELNVYDNIAVALNLQGEKNVSVNKVLSQVGLEGFENRKVTELSGGQRQRIAIARALIKSPKIIFADEPTGALDEATGNDILNLLKQLSSEKLIIVVSHDTDFATKYGDRIIHLSDGNIISDTNSEFSSNTDSESFSVKKPHLPFKTALRIGCANFKYHPFKLLLTIILSVMSFLLLGISTNIATNNNSLLIPNILKEASELNIIAKFDNINNTKMPLNNDDINYIASLSDQAVLPVKKYSLQFTDLKTQIIQPSIFGVCKYDEKFFEDNNFLLIGKKPEHPNEIVISATLASVLLSNFNNVSNINELIDHEIEINFAMLKICGIIQISNIFYKDSHAVNGITNTSNDVLSILENTIYVSNSSYIIEDSINLNILQSVIINDKKIYNYNTIKPFKNDPNTFILDNSISQGYILPFYSLHTILSNYSETISFNNLTFKSPLDLLYYLYDIYLSKNFDLIFNEINNEDEMINQIQKKDINNLTVQQIFMNLLIKYKTIFEPYYTVTFFNDLDNSHNQVIGFFITKLNDESIMCTETIYKDLFDNFSGSYNIIIFSPKSINTTILKNLINGKNYSNSLFKLDDNLSHKLRESVESMKTVQKYCIIVSIILGIFSIFLLFNFITQTIDDRHTTIRCLRCIGADKTSIIKIFFTNIILIDLVILITTYLLITIILKLLYNHFYLFQINYFMYIILALCIIPFSVLSIILPISNITKNAPIKYL